MEDSVSCYKNLKKRFSYHSSVQKGIQLAHAGRKASCYPTYYKYEENSGKLSRGTPVPDSEGGFSNKIRAPTAIAWSSQMPTPNELTISDIKELVQKFSDAAKRSVEAGVDVIEVKYNEAFIFII